MLLRKCNNSFFKLLTHFKLSDVTFNASLEDVQPSCFFFGVYSWKKLLQSKHNKVKKILCLLNTDRSIYSKSGLNFKQHILARKGKRRKTTYMYIDFFLSFALWFNTRSHNCNVYKIAPFGGIQDSLVFWIPHGTVDSGFQRVDSSLCHWK